MTQAFQSIVIAGASSGIGYALARWYGKSGHRAFGCGHRSFTGGLAFKYTPSDMCKTAMERLIESVSTELPANICLVSVYPGLVATPMLRQSLGEGAEAYPSAQDWSYELGPELLELDASFSGKHIPLQRVT